MLPFLRFLRHIRPAEATQRADAETDRAMEVPTAPEAHLAWFAGAPYAHVRNPDDERHDGEVRFATLLVPYH